MVAKILIHFTMYLDHFTMVLEIISNSSFRNKVYIRFSLRNALKFISNRIYHSVNSDLKLRCEKGLDPSIFLDFQY